MSMRMGLRETPQRKRRIVNQQREEGRLEVCIELSNWSFLCLRLPGFTGMLKSLTRSSSSSSVTEHHHIYDEQHLPAHGAYSNILCNRLPVVCADLNDYTPSFCPPGAPRFFSSTVVNSTLYCLGGNVDDIGQQCFYDIGNDPPLPFYISEPPPPPPRNSIENQFISFIKAYEQKRIPRPSIICPEQWDITDPQPNLLYSQTTTSTPPPPTKPISSKTIKEKGICHKAWMIDLHNPYLGWSQTKPLISPRLYPLLVSYQGKLYAFSGNHPSLPFAEVYDPLTHTWTALPPAPFGWLADSRMFVVPLKGWNQIWVFSVDGAVDYTFHVCTRKWQKLTSACHIIPHFSGSMHLVAAPNPDNHMLLYWITPQHMVYAYNLSTYQIFTGAIPGGDRVQGRLGFPLVMHHLQRDIFCLIGSRSPGDRHCETSVLHVTILQISTKPPPMPHKAPSKAHTSSPRSLTVAILACLAYPLADYLDIYLDIFSTYLMNNI